MEEILQNHEQQIRNLYMKHKWVGLFYNWLVAVCIVALFASFVWWGMDIHTRRMADEMTATALASWQAEQDAMQTAQAEELKAIQASQEYIMQQESTALAKAFYGLRLFIDKYNYSEADLTTYARCIFNRAEGHDLVSVVSAKDQFVGYSDDNPVLSEYYNLALKLVKEWHEESTKPCDVAYQYAELTPDGIFLKKDLHANAYERRWQA